jgi:TRAP transporter TAXI family solute receptor
LLASLSLLGLSTGHARTQQTKITLGTAMDGGAVAGYGAAFIDAMKLVDPSLEIQPVPTKGILDNVAMLEAGELDLALVFGEVTHELFAGIGRPPTKARVVSVMYAMPGMFVVRAESRYRSITDLKGRPVVWHGRNSGLTVQARYVMDGLGLDIEKDFEPIYPARPSEGPPLVIDGQAAALWGAGHRFPGFVAVAANPRGARFVAPDADQIKRIRAKHSFLGQFTIPAGRYRSQYDPITTVGSWTFLLARADLYETLGYRLALDLFTAHGTSQVSKHLADSTADNTLAAIASPDMLNPGVARFYRTTGMLR